MLGLPAFNILRRLGREAIPSRITRYPAYFSSHTTTRPFVLSVNNIIHSDIRKVYSEVDVPTLSFREERDGSLPMTYCSARRHCVLAQGFVEGTADHFGESLRIEHLQCRHQGNHGCFLGKSAS